MHPKELKHMMFHGLKKGTSLALGTFFLINFKGLFLELLKTKLWESF